MTRIVGTNVPRPEGPAKVEGRALYVADLDVPGAWIGGTVRSDVARGRLLGFERDPAFDFARVVIVGPEDVPGENVQALIVDDQPVLATTEVRHWGEPLLLVAAPDRATLHEALAAIQPRIAPLEPVLDLERSTQVFKAIDVDKGDVERAFAAPPRGARVIESTYHTDSQEQLYIEPQGGIAWPPERDGTITVKGSLQCPHYVRKALARCMGVALEKARVVQCETGGGFGGKEEYPSVVACHAALLAKKCGRPVKLLYERHEDLAVTPKRHPSRVRHKTLVAEDGTLLAMDVDVLFDGGAYTTLSPVVLSRGCIHAAGPYRCEHVRIRGRVVGTNHVPYGAFRGFGAPQTCFAVERQMDRVARALGIHPAELRWENRLRLGDTTATGQVLKESVGSTEVLEELFARTGFASEGWCGTVPGSFFTPSPARSSPASPPQFAARSRPPSGSDEGVKNVPGTVLHHPTPSSESPVDAAAIRSQARSSPIPAEQRRDESRGRNRGRTSQAPYRGRGLSFFFHGAGFTGSGEEMLKGRVRVALLPDGRIEVLAGSTEIGQGTNALFEAIAAEALGAEVADVVVATPDTARVPDSGPTVASRTCMVVGGCLANACRELVARIDGTARASASFRERARAFLARGGDGVVTVTYHSPPGLQWDDAHYRGDAYPVYGWAADLAEVEVDPVTFDVRVTRFWSTVDVGKALQPKLVEGQIEGGSLQALGWSQLEVITTRAGRFEQDRLATCIVPTTLDAPPMEVSLVEVPYSHGPFGAKGVGELPMDGGAPAVFAAIEDALHLHLTHVPATPERILDAWLAAHPEERA